MKRQGKEREGTRLLKQVTACKKYPEQEGINVRNSCHGVEKNPSVSTLCRKISRCWKGKGLVVPLAGSRMPHPTCLHHYIAACGSQNVGLKERKGNIKYKISKGKWMDFILFSWKKPTKKEELHMETPPHRFSPSPTPSPAYLCFHW